MAKHLRMHKSAIQTFCNLPVTLLGVLDGVVTDTDKADCTSCLEHAVEHHETQAKLAKNRLLSIAVALVAARPEKL